MPTWREDPEIQRLAEAYDLADDTQRPEILRMMAAERPAAIERQRIRTEVGPGQALAVGAWNEFMRLAEGARMLTGDEEDVASEQERRAEREQMYEPVREARPVSTAVGEVATGMAVPGGAGKTLTRRVLGSALAGGGYEYVGSGGDETRAALAAATAPVFSEAGRGVGRWLLGRPDVPPVKPGRVGAEHQRIVDESRQLGRAMSPAQEQASRGLQQYEASFARNPYMSAPFTEQLEQNQQLANRFAREAIGLTGDDILTDEVLKAQEKNLGSKFEEIVGKDRAFPISEGFADAIGEIEKERMRGLTRTGEARRILKNLKEMSDDQYMTVKDYQQNASDLAGLARELKVNDPSGSRALYAAREVLDLEFDREFGEIAELKENRMLWRRLRQIEDSGAIRQGNFRPTIFYNFLRGKKEGRGRVRDIEKPLEKLSRAEHHFASTIPDSGTPTASSVVNYIQASTPSKVMMNFGNEFSRAYMANPRIIAGPGALGYIPQFAQPFLGPVQTGIQRAGRQYGVQEAQGEGLLAY